MLTADPASPRAATGTRMEVDQLLADLSAGRAAPSATSLPETFVQTVSETLAATSGQVEVEIADPLGRSAHCLLLSRAGTLRRSRGFTEREELAVHPTSTLPGVLLRLAAIAPTEPLPAEVTVTTTPQELADLFAADSTRSVAAWARVTEAGGVLPPAAQDGIDQAPPRAVRLVRRRETGDGAAALLLLRGRYLVAAGTDATTLRGTTPTGAARALLRPLLTVSG